MQTQKLRIAPDGVVTLLWSDDLAPSLLAAGTGTVRRASHVEPTLMGRWVADLAPIGGPKLGPYVLRQQALDAERTWIETHILGSAEALPATKGDVTP